MKYYLFALVLLACNNNDEKTSSSPIPLEALDTIQLRPSKIDARPRLFDQAFVKGASTKVKDKNLFFYGVNMGKIKIISGRIIACDPMHIEEYGIPFTQVFPTGEFPVQLSIVNVENLESIVFARILFSDKPVARWEFALKKEEKQIPLGEEDIHGYSTDGGVGMFMDEASIKSLDSKATANFEGEVFKQMKKRNGWKYLMYNFNGHNLAAFSSGLGDGYYATYIGIDANNQPCRLLTDFGIIDWKIN